jgi:hypothetical protein
MAALVATAAGLLADAASLAVVIGFCFVALAYLGAL